VAMAEIDGEIPQAEMHPGNNTTFLLCTLPIYGSCMFYLFQDFFCNVSSSHVSIVGLLLQNSCYNASSYLLNLHQT
jgi:hypothetical protein